VVRFHGLDSGGLEFADDDVDEEEAIRLSATRSTKSPVYEDVMVLRTSYEYIDHIALYREI